MSWKDSLLDASFRGVTFDCISTSDQTSRALATHDYPMRDGGELDDMGRNPRQCDITAIFFGEDYEYRLQKFLTALDEGGPGELVHPVFGVLPVGVRDYSIKHDAEGPDRADVNISFVESGLDNPFFMETLTPKGKVENESAKASNSLDKLKVLSSGSLSAWLSKNLPQWTLTAADTARQSIDLARRCYTQLSGGGDSLIDYLNAPAALVDELLGLANGVAALQPLEGLSRLRGLSGLFSGFSLDSEQAELSSGKSYSSAYTQAETLLEVEPQGAAPATDFQAVDSLGKADLSIFSGQFSARLCIVVNIINFMVFVDNACACLTAETKTLALRPHEVEGVACDVRSRAQDIVEALRKTLPAAEAYPQAEELRTVAHSVQEAARAVLNARPPLITHTVEGPVNLHLLAFKLHGDYSRADELLRLNPQILKPNFIKQNEAVRCYAK